MVQSAVLDARIGNYTSAVEKFEKAVEIHPTYEGAWQSLAMAHKDNGNLPLAEIAAERGLKILPESSALWTTLGTFRIQVKGFESLAEDAYRKALEYAPENSIAALNLSSTVAEMGKLEEAEKILTKSREGPRDLDIFAESDELASHIWAQLAWYRAQLGDHSGTREAGEKSLAIEKNSVNVRLVKKAYALIDGAKSKKQSPPDECDILYDEGFRLKQEGHLDAAMEFYEKALSVDPSREDLRVSIASLLIDLQRYSEVEPILKPAIDANSQHDLIWYNYGMSLLALDKDAEAEVAIKKSLEMKEDNANAWYNLGVIADRQGRTQDIEDAYRRAVEIDHDYFDAWTNLGVLFIETNRRDEAEAAFRKAIRQTRNFIPWENLGHLLIDANRCKEARELLEEARKFSPMNIHVLKLGARWLQKCTGN